MREGSEQQWRQIGKTEVVKDNLNPAFKTSFMITYYFEKHQFMRFKVLDGDNMLGNVKMIGTADTTVGTIVGSSGSSLTMNITNSNRVNGMITLKFDPVHESNLEVAMRVGARNLPSTTSCFCANNNILLGLYRQSSDNSASWLKVYETEPMHGTVNPVYPSFKISGQQLCNSNRNLPLQIRFYNLVNMERTLLSQCTTSLA